jgi:hypothetical protein
MRSSVGSDNLHALESVDSAKHASSAARVVDGGRPLTYTVRRSMSRDSAAPAASSARFDASSSTASSAAQVGGGERGRARVGGRRRQLQLARRAHARVVVLEKRCKRHIVGMVGVEVPVQRAAQQLLAKRQRGEPRARRQLGAAHDDALGLVLVAEPLVVFVRCRKTAW